MSAPSQGAVESVGAKDCEESDLWSQDGSEGGGSLRATG